MSTLVFDLDEPIYDRLTDEWVRDGRWIPGEVDVDRWVAALGYGLRGDGTWWHA